MLTSNDPLTLPAKLKSLLLRLDGDPTDAAVNGVLAALAAGSLSHLHLQISRFAAETSVELSILGACPSLTDLMLVPFCGRLAHAQVDQIRVALGHMHRLSIGTMANGQLARLLQPPVTAQWRDIGEVLADAGTGELLLRLPTLTRLSLSYDEATAHADFLQQLPRLTTLTLNCYRFGIPSGWHIPADALLNSLVRCRALTELDLSCGFNSAHWSALVAELPLKMLTLRNPWALETLACFAAGPITQSLEDLTVEGLELPASELSHLYGLYRLRTLDLRDCFCSILPKATLKRLSPPSRILPALTKLVLRGLANVDRQGPSFEWMQMRRTR